MCLMLYLEGGSFPTVLRSGGSVPPGSRGSVLACCTRVD
jgi:hypothetical protein